MAADGGGLRKRRTERTSIERSVIRDTQLSFRALGVLLWLLDRPDGWQVRAEQMANDGLRTDGTGPGGDPHRREGRDSIRTALKELADAGYYRLERRRLRNGMVKMGTSISEESVDRWAEQWRHFGARAVPVVEQFDGSFLVQYPDGSLLPDDFPSPDPIQQPDQNGSEYDDLTGDGFSGPGAGDGKPGPGKPATGKPATGKTSPLEEDLVSLLNKEKPPIPPASGGPNEPKAEEQQFAVPHNTDPPPPRCAHGQISCRACGTTPRQRAQIHTQARNARLAIPCPQHRGQPAHNCAPCRAEQLAAHATARDTP